jgi:phage I-like protein
MKRMVRVLAGRPLELGPEGGAPIAFRIWEAGENQTDHGPVVFSPDSAKLLLEEQTRRGNLFSIDYDHLSLEKERPATAGQAAGWHRLEVRDGEGGPELWAVDVEWCVEAKAGIEERPPRWRYFSPAYFVDPDSREVTSYVNTALCINPATWHNNALATRATRNGPMKKAAMLAALKAMAEGDGDDKQKENAAALFASMGGEDALKAAADGGDDAPDSKKPGDGAGDGDGGDDAPDSKKPKGDAADGGDDTPDSAKPKGDAKRKATKAGVDLAVRVATLEQDVARGRVKELVRAHADRFTPTTRAWALEQPYDIVKSYVKVAPKQNLRAPETQTATRGEDAGKPIEERSPGKLQKNAATEADVDRAFGIRSNRTEVGFSAPRTGLRELNTMTPSEARDRAKKAG